MIDRKGNKAKKPKNTRDYHAKPSPNLLKGNINYFKPHFFTNLHK